MKLAVRSIVLLLMKYCIFLIEFQGIGYAKIKEGTRKGVIMEIIVLLGGTIIGIFILWILAKLFSISFKILLKLVFNALGGAVTLLLFNLIGGLLGVGIHITFINALIAGIFGIPGVIFLLILQVL